MSENVRYCLDLSGLDGALFECSSSVVRRLFEEKGFLSKEIRRRVGEGREKRVDLQLGFLGCCKTWFFHFFSMCSVVLGGISCPVCHLGAKKDVFLVKDNC